MQDNHQREPPILALLHQPRPDTLRYQEGYDIHQVDRFLDHLTHMAHDRQPIDPDTIRTITFDTHWYQEAYDTGQVDALLDRLAEALAPPPRHAGRGAVA